MTEPKRDELNVEAQRAILVGVYDPAERIDCTRALEELEGLATTAGVHVVGRLSQARRQPHPATYLGRGKLEELKQLVAAHDASLVIFDNGLTPAQGRNLEKATKAIIVDRSELILGIFATHARTYEAKLQVDLAQLLYLRPRLKRMWTHLERIEGGIGTGRGPGEKQIEVDRRLIDRRIADLRRKLKLLETRRERVVRQRHEHWTVSLVGYTNAGKSTLMNALTGAGVYVADKLFATLDTRTRRWRLPRIGDVLLSDTVGFVRNLPHHLVASFKSTLEEARQADLLLHVVDISHPEAEQQIAVVRKVLDEIQVDRSNELLVLNKIDALENRAVVDILRAQDEATVSVSAVTGAGLDRLTAEVERRLADGYVDLEIETDVGNGRLFSWLAEHADVSETTYHDSRVTLRCRLPRRLSTCVGENGDATSVRVLGNGEPV